MNIYSEEIGFKSYSVTSELVPLAKPLLVYFFKKRAVLWGRNHENIKMPWKGDWEKDWKRQEEKVNDESRGSWLDGLSEEWELVKLSQIFYVLK